VCLSGRQRRPDYAEPSVHIGEMSAGLAPADRHEVVHANPLHDEKLAGAIGLAVHVMCRLRRYRAALARQQPVDVTRRSRLDHHWPLQANKTVADLAVVMPRYALPGGKAQYLDAQIRALGNQLAACDRIIAAVARLHRLVPFVCLRDTGEDFAGYGTIFTLASAHDNSFHS